MLAQELERLATMHRQGLLTDAEYAQAKARVLGAAATGMPMPPAGSSLRRSVTDRWVGGVCGGLARATGIEAWIWRLAAVGFTLFGGSGLLAYVLLWIFIPRES